nr:DUF6504 family protein [Zhihengliuella flava]
MGLFTQGIEVICSSSGAPELLQWQEQDFRVTVPPVRWFERRNWWTEEPRVQRGNGAGVVDHEMWRVQAVGARDGSLRTFEVSRHQRSGRWRMIRVHDAVREAA